MTREIMSFVVGAAAGIAVMAALVFILGQTPEMLLVSALAGGFVSIFIAAKVNKES